jgi:hypothetical protein
MYTLYINLKKTESLAEMPSLGCGGSSAVGRGWAGWHDHDQQHCYHHAPTVKPEAAPAVVELLMMGVGTPETC